MDYRNESGISKSGLQALWESVSKFRKYLSNEHNPFPPEHFLLGMVVEDLVLRDVVDVNENYVVKDLEFPSNDTVDGAIFNLLKQSGLQWEEISDEQKLEFTELANMSSRFKEDTRLKKVNQLKEIYEAYLFLNEGERILVPRDLWSKAVEKRMILRMKVPELINHTEAKVVLKRTVDDIVIKGELDWIYEDDQTVHIIDLKTYGSRTSKKGWLYQCLKYGYYEQAYNYVELVKENYPDKKVFFSFLVIDNENTCFRHQVTEEELLIGKHGYSHVNGRVVNQVEDNTNPGFDTKFELYKWYMETYTDDVEFWPTEHPDLLKNNHYFHGVL